MGLARVKMKKKLALGGPRCFREAWFFPENDDVIEALVHHSIDRSIVARLKPVAAAMSFDSDR